MEDEYPIDTPGAHVSVPRMTDEGVRDGLVAEGAVVMKGCECGGRFERVDDIVIDIRLWMVGGLLSGICMGSGVQGAGLRCFSPESMRTVERRARGKRSNVGLNITI
jgi:hypothetical protein